MTTFNDLAPEIKIRIFKLAGIQVAEALQIRTLSRAMNVAVGFMFDFVAAFVTKLPKTFKESRKGNRSNINEHIICCMSAPLQQAAFELGGTNSNFRVLRGDPCTRGFPTLIPSFVGSAIYLERIVIQGCGLTAVAVEIGTLHNLKALVLSNNKITVFPQSVRSLIKLTYLDLSNNLITGRLIPRPFAENTRLEVLNLSGNRLYGQIPADWDRLRSTLMSLNLSRNCLSGPILPTLDLFINLELLNLSHNKFDNNLFPPIFNYTEGFKSLKFAYFQQNKLTGPIPACILKYATNLEILDFSCNIFSGLIPPIIGDGNVLRALRKVFLQGNRLVGQVPVELAGLPRLEEVNVSHNSLVGQVPQEILVNPGLKKLDLRGNSGMDVAGLASAQMAPKKLLFGMSCRECCTLCKHVWTI
ncbi:hypothetical protein HDU98_002817 [Podochytrium sp. JEL0797]|nr:hypothetical protein HDU98_002817 [Podochytrium sp. JEL0797]